MALYKIPGKENLYFNTATLVTQRLNPDGSYSDVDTNGAAHAVLGSAGGSGAVTTLLDAATATGAGTAANGLGGRCTYQAVANGTSGAFSAAVIVQGSNDGTNWETLGTITLSGTATTADSDGFAVDAPWAHVRGYVSAISGTGANVSLYRGV